MSWTILIGLVIALALTVSLGTALRVELHHQAAGIPTSCEACHSTSRWTGASFNHSFPLSGPHNLSCNDCHLVPNDFVSFSCTHCHEHSQSEMNEEHGDVDGYVWESSACLMCHPTGRD